MNNQDILNEALQGLAPLQSLCDNLMQSVPIEVTQALPQAKMDMNSIFESMKNGDTSKITELQNKYANQIAALNKKD